MKIKNKPDNSFFGYKIIGIIGKGGGGEIYLAIEKKNGKLVAIKRILKSEHTEKSSLREKDLMVILGKKADWAVKIHSSFQDEFYLYIIMDYIQGGDLYTFICKNNFLSTNEIKLYMAQIVNSVSKFHEIGYLHGDIKPQNLLINKNGDVVLSDFGCAKKLESIQVNIEKGGTILYSPPEVLDGKNYDKGSDWWSVGCVLYELFTKEIYGKSYGNLEYKESSKIPEDANDLLKKIMANKNIRIGEKEIKNHPFFNGLDWNNLYNKKILKHPNPLKPLKNTANDFFDKPVGYRGYYIKGFTFNPPLNYKSKTFHFNIKYIIIFFLIFSFFISPLLYKNCDIGMPIYNRSIVRFEQTVGIIYQNMQYYLDQDDYFFIQETIIQPSFNDSNFVCYESVMLKYEVLYSLNNFTKYPTYIIPKGLATCVYQEIDSTFSIRIITYEKDNKKKVYKKSNVPIDSFEIQIPENNIKNKITSRFGDHYFKQKFIIKQRLSPIEHYKTSLKIQFNRIITLFLITTTNHFDNYNKDQGFDNFGDISQVDNLNKNF